MIFFECKKYKEKIYKHGKANISLKRDSHLYKKLLDKKEWEEIHKELLNKISEYAQEAIKSVTNKGFKID